MPKPFEEGEHVYVKARIYRTNRDQSFIEFVSMDETRRPVTFSINVPNSELIRIRKRSDDGS